MSASVDQGDGPTPRSSVPIAAWRWRVTFAGAGASHLFSGAPESFDDALSLAVSSGAAGTALARAVRPAAGAAPIGWPRDEGDVMVRAVITAGEDDADGAILVGLGGPKSTDGWVALRCGADGTWRLVDSSGADLTMDVVGPSVEALTGGNLFLRIARAAVGVVASWGVASDADHYPLTWNPVAVATTVDALYRSQGCVPVVGAKTTGGGVSGGFTFQVTGVGLFGRSKAGGESPRVTASGDRVLMPKWTPEDAT